MLIRASQSNCSDFSAKIYGDKNARNGHQLLIIYALHNIKKKSMNPDRFSRELAANSFSITSYSFKYA